MLQIKGVGIPKLTQVLFLINPKVFLPFDTAGVLPLGIGKFLKPPATMSWDEYVDEMGRIRAAFPGCECYEINVIGYLWTSGQLPRKGNRWYQISASDDGWPDFVDSNWVYHRGQGDEHPPAGGEVPPGPKQVFRLDEPKPGDVVLVRSGRQGGRGIGIVYLNDYSEQSSRAGRIHVLWVNKEQASLAATMPTVPFWVFWKTGADVRWGRGWKRQHCRYDIGGSQGVLYLEVIPKGVSMRIETLVKETLDLQGFRVGRVDGGTDEIVVRIVADGRYAPRCGECGEKAKYRDERRERRYRHVPLWGIPVTLVYTLRRVRCKGCGLRVEAVPWAEGKQRFTRAMSVTMAEWAKLLPWSHVARMFGCSWSTVQQAVKAVVAYGRERQELDGLTHIGVDEIARKRGHVYMTVVYDLKKSRLVWVGDGRTRETLERFFDFLGEDRSKRLEAVCCDMWRSYVNAVRARAPQALIVFDKFHIVSHLGKAVNEVRREEIREKGQAHKDLVKNSRYLWLKNPWNLTGGQAERLATLVRLNTEVHRAYLLKEMFRRFWEYKRPGWAKRFLKLWCAWAVGTGLSPLRKFARTMLRHMDDILNYFRARITNGAVEGMNNKAKVVMRRAYGLRTAESCATNLYHCLASLPMPELSHRFA